MQANADDHPSGNVENSLPSVVAESPAEAFLSRNVLSPFAWAALAALGAALAWNAWRASLEGGIWSDEIFSILISKRPIGELIDLTALDNHPPFYYLLLKAWDALGEAAGLTPGAFWGRLPGLAGWLAAVAVAWRVGRRTLGRDGGALLALAMACVPQALWGIRNLRGYATAVPALEICFLLMFAMTESTRRGTLTRRGAAIGWTVYALAIEAALWSHLLAGFVAFLLGLWWIAESAALARREGAGRALRSPLVVGGGVAQGLAALCFMPWLSQLRNQVGMLDAVRRPWMTPPTAINYLKVFALWYPLGGKEGNAPLPSPEFWSWPSAFGCLTVLVPVAALAWGWRRARAGASSGAARRLAVAGLVVALLNVAIIWSVDRLQIQYVFHARRYVMFTSALWGAGLAGLAFWASELDAPRVGKGIAWLLLAPWLIMNVAGAIIDGLDERASGLPTDIASGTLHMPPPGASILVQPSELIPYFSKTLAPWKPLPIEAMPQASNGSKDVWFLLMHPFFWIDTERDVALLSLLKANKLGVPVDITQSVGENYFTAVRIKDFRAEEARKFAEAGFGARPIAPPPGAWETTGPTQWRRRDGWGYLEVDPNLTSYRWSSRLVSRIRLTRPLGPGEIAIRLQGALPPSADKPTPPPVGLAIEGEPTVAGIDLPQGGSFDRVVRLKLLHRHEKPTIVFVYPVRFIEEQDALMHAQHTVGFLLHMAAIVNPGDAGDPGKQ
jgi:hypothetical protein